LSTTSKSFTIVFFCAAEQISTILKVLRSKTMSLSDAPGDTKSYQCSVCEAVWLKSGHRFHARESPYLALNTYRIEFIFAAKGGALGRDCEVMVIGLFVDKDHANQDTLRSLIKMNPGRMCIPFQLQVACKKSQLKPKLT
jgi:hypothetical protein